LLDMAEAGTLTITGAPSDVSTTPIDLIAGWNWISYLPQNSGDVGEALSSVSDLATSIVSQSNGYSQNYGVYGWFGGLNDYGLQPGKGYQLNMSDSGVLTYPEFNGLARAFETEKEINLTEAISDWDFNHGDYRHVGGVTVSVESREDFDGDLVGVFVDGKCRGIAERMHFPFNDSYVYMVQVYSNVVDGEELHFKYHDSSRDEIVEFAETMTFVSNMMVGDGFNAFALSSEVGQDVQPVVYGLSEAYPNPFNPVTRLSYDLPADGMVNVSVYDINGRLVAELANGYMLAGTHPVTWDAGNLSSGVYVIKMLANEEHVSMQKIMLIK